VLLALSADRGGTRIAGTAVVVTLAGALVAVLALQAAHTAPELGYAGSSARGAATLLVPGLAAIGVALESLRRGRRDRCALLLALAGLASFLPELSVAGARPALAFTAGLVLASATPPLIAHLALIYPDRPEPRSVRVLRNAGYLCAIGILGLLPTLVFDPVAAGCGQCSANLALVHGSAPLEAPLARAGIIATLVWATLSIAVLLHRLAAATPAARRNLWPILIPAGVLLGCFATELALSLRRAYLSTETIDRQLWLGGQAALLGVALGIATRWLRTRRARAMLARDVIELSDQAEADTVAVRLSRALNDPTLEIAYPVGEPTRFVEAHGAPVDLEPRPGSTTTVLHAPTDEPTALAVIRHREGLLDDPALVDEIARAARLALANERLRADARERLALLQSSRKRIAAAADAERQQLERNLHDGAQQRLVSLAVTIRAARSTNGRESAVLDDAQAEVQRALDELRVVARGIYPAVLAEMGLAPAIEALAETAPIPVKVGELPALRFDPTVESTAYFAIAEAVHDPAAARAAISGRHDGETLMLAVTTDASACDVTRLSDRIGAAGGVIRRQPLPGKVVLEVEIPCGS
jgi:signal transduction histidine kinase